MKEYARWVALGAVVAWSVGCTTTGQTRTQTRSPGARPSTHRSTPAQGQKPKATYAINMVNPGWGTATAMKCPSGKLVAPGSDYYLEPAGVNAPVPPLEKVGQNFFHKVSFVCQGVSPQAMSADLAGKRVRIRTVFLTDVGGPEGVTEYQLKSDGTGIYACDVLVKNVDGRWITDPVVFLQDGTHPPRDWNVYCVMTEPDDNYSPNMLPLSNIVVLKVTR